MFNESTMESSIDWLLFLVDMISFAIFFFFFILMIYASMVSSHLSISITVNFSLKGLKPTNNAAQLCIAYAATNTTTSVWSIKSGKRPTLFESFLFERQIIIIIIKCIFYDISTLFQGFFIFPQKKSYFSKNEKKIQFNNHICSTIHQVTRFSNTKRAIRKLNICLFVCTSICLMIVEREKCLGN